MSQLIGDNPCRPRHFRPAPCGPAPTEGPAKDALEISHTRLLIAGALFVLAFMTIAARLIEVGGFKSADLHIARLHPAAKPDIARADIVDRNGTLLATTLDVPSLFANPKQVQDKRGTAHALAAILPETSEAELYARLTSDKSFVWLGRQLTPRQEYAVNQLGIPGLDFATEGKRVYPKGNLAAHVVGYSGIDNNGLAGIERGLDDTLKMQTGPVQLSIDARLQYILRSETARQMAQFEAQAATGLIMDVHTGEVLALVSLPDFDLNAAGSAKPEAMFDRATLGVYEVGSIFKIFNTAMALDAHTATLASRYDATKPIEIAGFTIHDDHPLKRWLSVPEIFEYSSNIGAAKMAAEAGTERQRDMLGRLGLLHAPSFELPELGVPMIPRPWLPISTMTVAFGHGISVSLLQVASATSAAINGGMLYPPTILKRPDGVPVQGQRVLSPQTSTDMRKLLRLVVEDGTGKYADAPGYVVGGKTGTAEKAENGRYATHALMSSFVGAFPMNDPRYVVIVMLDEPKPHPGASATGGMVAAPAVARIIERMAPIVGIQPVDENSPEIRRSLMVGSPSPQGRKLAAN
ncbi:MAG TPA: penicillin-binding protein 2 [Stellaceae bacterium]|jgi:cell division protein FtsI (penicillin-binding protein 3)|nr:penicillin-binding protein 2 [Stellaceae bacterium]